MEIFSLALAWMLMAPIIWWINRGVARAEERQHPVKRALPDNVVDLAPYRGRAASVRRPHPKRRPSDPSL